MHPNDAKGIANSVDPDQTAPLGAVWSGSALFAQICLSENLGTLQYNYSHFVWVCKFSDFYDTVKILKIRTPEKNTVIILKLEQYCFTTV